MADRSDALDSNAYKDAIADISHAIRTPEIWGEVNTALKRGIANGNLSYEGLESILPKIGISGDLITSQFDNLNTDKGNGYFLGMGNDQLSNEEISNAQAYSDNPLEILAANLIQKDRATIENTNGEGDMWRDHVSKEELTQYATDVRSSVTDGANVAKFTDGRDGVIELDGVYGDGSEDEEDDERSDDDERGYDEVPEDDEERDSDDDDVDDEDEDEDEEEVAEEARVNDEYFQELDVDDLKSYLAKDSKDPADRLRAAWELAQRGEKVVTLKNGDEELTVEISTDENGYISLWSQGVNGPLMKGLVKENQVVTQDGNYFGKSWRSSHGEELFDEE